MLMLSQAALAAAATPAPLYDPDGELARLDITPELLAANRIFSFRNADRRARPFKLLRSHVARRVATDGLKLIGVTSAAPDVGKSFVAANLAAALCRIGDHDVCLIDMDMHRPTLAARFGCAGGPGVHDLLAGAATVEQVARRVGGERLVLIPGFKRDVATGELLTGARGDALFAGLRALPRSTIVIVDMPPIFADDDAVIIGQRIDGYLLIAEDGKTTARQVRDVQRMLSPTPMVGSILNRYRQPLFADEQGYGRSYGYGAYY